MSVDYLTITRPGASITSRHAMRLIYYQLECSVVQSTKCGCDVVVKMTVGPYVSPTMCRIRYAIYLSGHRQYRVVAFRILLRY